MCNQALSNAHTFLYEERELLLETKAENEALHQHLKHLASKSQSRNTQAPPGNNTFRPVVPGRQNCQCSFAASFKLL